jgi:glycosyltransferase involved in cell wall biosynthesis
MRVIHVAPTPFGAGGLFGGGERYPVELARALAQEIDCELVTFGSRPGVANEDGLRVRTLQAVHYVRGHPAQPFAPAVIPALAGADIVHVHHMRSLPSRMAVLLARLRRQAIVVTDHGLSGSSWLGLLPRLFDRCLAVSAYSARELKAPAARTSIIYGGADPHRYAPDEGTARQGVLFVGRLTPHKGIDRLIQALPPGARLSIVGSEGHDPDLPERDYPRLLRRLGAGRDVEFLGPVGDGLLPDLYRRAAVLVLPSVERTCYGRPVGVSELLGLVVLEAMASGTPVVCSRLGGLPEVVQDGITGLLVPPGDIAALRDALAELLCDSARAQRMGQAARELAAQRFTWQACAERCLAAYRALGQR